MLYGEKMVAFVRQSIHIYIRNKNEWRLSGYGFGSEARFHSEIIFTDNGLSASFTATHVAPILGHVTFFLVFLGTGCFHVMFLSSCWAQVAHSDQRYAVIGGDIIFWFSKVLPIALGATRAIAPAPPPFRSFFCDIKIP